MIQNIIITTITIPTIPTQTPALKIVPIAAQLLSENIAANIAENKINMLLFILKDLYNDIRFLNSERKKEGSMT